MDDIKILILILLVLYVAHIIYKYFLRPWLIEKATKEIEVNPKWITSKLQKDYYGFNDIDIILADTTFGWLPRFRLIKNNRLQLLISEDTTTKDVEEIGRVILAAKIKIKYGLWFPDKPIHWLSILCYMLDGGDIKQEETSWENVDK